MASIARLLQRYTGSASEVKISKFPGLDGLRALAASGVIVHHIEQARFVYGFANHWEFPAINRLGPLCVSFFFVLSGFLITWLLLEEQRTTGEISVSSFYARRVLRIWPLYFFIVFLGFFVIPLIAAYNFPGDSGARPFFWETFTLYILFSPHVASAIFPPEHFAGVLWSVGVEEWFYIGWPLLIVVLRRRVALVSALMLIIILLLIAHVTLAVIVNASFTSPTAIEHVFRPLLYFVEQLRFDCMAFGALGAIGLLTFRGIASPMMAALFAKPLFSMQMQLVVFPFILYCILSGKDFFMLDQQVYSILFLWVILNIGTNPDSIIRLESGVMRWLGKISYGLYCFNWITIVGAIIIVRSVFHRADAPVAQMCMQWLAVALTVAAFLLAP